MREIKDHEPLGIFKMPVAMGQFKDHVGTGIHSLMFKTSPDGKLYMNKTSEQTKNFIKLFKRISLV